jgi:predicted RND superfamily exporter protein
MNTSPTNDAPPPLFQQQYQQREPNEHAATVKSEDDNNEEELTSFAMLLSLAGSGTITGEQDDAEDLVVDGYHNNEQRTTTLLVSSPISSSSQQQQQQQQQQQHLHLDGYNPRNENKTVVAIVSWWNSVLRRSWWIILILVVGFLWPSGLVWALPTFQSHTDSTFHHGIDGSPSRLAEQAMERAYNNNDNNHNNNNNHNQSSHARAADHSIVLQPSWIIVVQAASTSSIHLAHDNYTQHLALGLQDYLLQTTTTTSSQKNDHPSSTNNCLSNHLAVQVSSYYSFQRENLTMLAKPFMSKDGKTTMIQVQYDIQQRQHEEEEEDDGNTNNTTITTTAPLNTVSNSRTLTTTTPSATKTTTTKTTTTTTTTITKSDLMERLHQYYTVTFPPPKDISISVTGLDQFSQDLRTSTQHDLRHMDLLVIPAALLLVGLVLQSKHGLSTQSALGVVWIIPLCAIASTIATWSLIMTPIACSQWMQITQFTPSIMMSLTLGMGIDYTLFLLSRYLESILRLLEDEQRRRREDYPVPHEQDGEVTETITADMKQQAIYDMLRHGGQVVFVSGCTLLCTFLGLVALPLPMLKSIGVGAAVTLASTMIVNVIVVVPTLLYSPIGTWIITVGSIPSSATGAQLLPTTTTTNAIVVIASAAVPTMNGHGHEPPPSPRIPMQGEQHQQHQRELVVVQSPPKSFWVRLCRNYLLHPYKSVICMVLTVQLLWLPIAKNVVLIDSSDISFESLLPKNAPSLLAYHALEQEIGGGPGKLTPFRVLFVHKSSSSNSSNGVSPNTTSRIDSVQAFDEMHRIIYHLLYPTVNFSETDTIFQESTVFAPSNQRGVPDNQSATVASHPKSATANSLTDIWRLQLEECLEQRRLARNPDNNNNNETNIPFHRDGETLSLNVTAWSPWLAAMSSVMTSTDDYNDGTFSDASSTLSADTIPRSIWPQQHETQADIRAKRIASLAKFTGITVWNNIPIPFGAYLAAKLCTSQEPNVACPVEAMRALNILDYAVTSPNHEATFATVSLSVSPFSKDGIAWLDQSRQILQDYQQYNDNHKTYYDPIVDTYIDGTAAIAHDAVNAVYDNFLQVIAITVLVVMAFMGWFFQSVVPPLRSIVSIFFTITFSYGLAVLVFQDGMIQDWTTHLRTLAAIAEGTKKGSTTSYSSSATAELCWLVPIMSFSIIVGLALDYDVFLVSRIYEFRFHHSYQHASSIVAGLDATGGIITAAGIIMALSFGSLLTSASPALQQWSFLLTTAVFLDTFVVRSVVVPILAGWTGPEYGWYPQTVTRGSVRWEGFDTEPYIQPQGEEGERSLASLSSHRHEAVSSVDVSPSQRPSEVEES